MTETSATTKTGPWLGFLISAVALVVACYRTDWSRLGHLVFGITPACVLGALVCTQAELIFGAWRWKILIESVARPRWGMVYNYYMIGYLFNQLLPARPGEIIRSVLFARKIGSSKAALMATAVVEKAADVFVLAGFMMLLAFIMPIPRAIYVAGLTAGGGTMALLLVLAWFVRWPTGANRCWSVLVRVLPRRFQPQVRQWLDRGLQGLAALGNARAAATGTAASLLVWTAGIGVTQFFLLAFGLHLPWYAPIFVLVVTNLGMMVPSSPGAVGVAHLLYIVSLAPFGVDKTMALAVGVVIHGLGYLQIVLLGLVALWREHVRFGAGKREIAETSSLA